MTKEDIEGWFKEVREDLEKIPGALAALKEPSRVFNADKMGFALDATGGRAVKIIVE